MPKNNKHKNNVARGFREPHDWANPDHRLKGLKEFIRQVGLDEKEAYKCCSSPEYAKRMFAQWGGFYLAGSDHPEGITTIPASTKFRIHPHGTANQLRRDKRVIIVLPRKQGEEAENYEPEDIALWRCSYTPYVTRKHKKAKR